MVDLVMFQINDTVYCTQCPVNSPANPALQTRLVRFYTDGYAEELLVWSCAGSTNHHCINSWFSWEPLIE